MNGINIAKHILIESAYYKYANFRMRRETKQKFVSLSAFKNK